jgi:hypothetical protein
MRKFLAATTTALAALCAIAIAAPAQASRIDISATVLAKPIGPFVATLVGDIGGTGFFTTAVTLTGTGDTADWADLGGGIFSLAFGSAQVSIAGGADAAITTPLFGLFDSALGVFSLSVSATPPAGAIVVATPTAPLTWDRASALPRTDVGFYAIDWTTLNASYLATSLGQLTLEFGTDGDGSGPGYLAATVSDVPVPATAPLLLGALALLGFGRARRRA